MKHIIFGVFGGAIIILSILVCLNIHRRHTYEAEFQTALNNTCDQASVVLLNHTYQNEKDFQSYFLETMQSNFKVHADDPNYHLDCEFLAVDTERGVFGVTVTETYSSINGAKKKLTDSRTVILEEELTMAACDITYLIPEDIATERQIQDVYHAYRAEIGTTLPVPEDPTIEGLTFTGWVEVNDEEGSSANSSSNPASNTVSNTVSRSDLLQTICTTNKTYIASFQ